MIKGEYRGASLGWLIAILVAVAVWALIWGPGDGEDEVPADEIGFAIGDELDQVDLPPLLADARFSR